MRYSGLDDDSLWTVFTMLAKFFVSQKKPHSFISLFIKCFPLNGHAYAGYWLRNSRGKSLLYLEFKSNSDVYFSPDCVTSKSNWTLHCFNCIQGSHEHDSSLRTYIFLESCNVTCPPFHVPKVSLLKIKVGRRPRSMQVVRPVTAATYGTLCKCTLRGTF